MKRPSKKCGPIIFRVPDAPFPTCFLSDEADDIIDGKASALLDGVAVELPTSDKDDAPAR